MQEVFWWQIYLKIMRMLTNKIYVLGLTSSTQVEKAAFSSFLIFLNSVLINQFAQSPVGILTSPECSFTLCDVDGLPWPRDADKIEMQ